MAKKFVLAPALIAAVVLFTPGCEDSPTDPEDDEITFTAQLSPANEVPPVTGPDASGSGTVSILLEVDRDSAGTITGGTADFDVNLTGFPAGTVIAMAHIHSGATGVNGPVEVDTGVTSGQVVLTNGAGSFTRTGIAVTGEDARAIVDSPGGFYFNVHTVLTPSGAVRGQLSRQ